MDIESHNLQQIRRTNQRGGRCLSVIDLIEAGTLSPDAAALCWNLIDRGAAFITGAVPGGAGKTTLMAALLAFLPPGERILTAKDRSVVEGAAGGQPDTPLCLLAHEIGRGSWFAYIWGRTAREFFACNGPRRRPVTCLHADTPDQTADILQECGVEEGDINAIDLHLYIRAFGTIRPRHRVTAVHCRLGGDLVPVYRWDKDSDRLRPMIERTTLVSAAEEQFDASPAQFVEQWRTRRERLEGMQSESVQDFQTVRSRILHSYESHR
jgi:hypothetical protein